MQHINFVHYCTIHNAVQILNEFTLQQFIINTDCTVTLGAQLNNSLIVRSTVPIKSSGKIL